VTGSVPFRPQFTAQARDLGLGVSGTSVQAPAGADASDRGSAGDESEGVHRGCPFRSGQAGGAGRRLTLSITKRE
jgi:hypothetical protein